MAIRDKFRTFEGEWKDFLPVKDLAIPRLRGYQATKEIFGKNQVGGQRRNEYGGVMICCLDHQIEDT